jgi:predicted nucleotidyltransferase
MPDGSPPAGHALDTARVQQIAAHNGWRLVVLFGSTARGERGRDLDIAVLPGGPPAAPGPDLLTHGRWQAALETACAPIAVDLVLLGPGLSPVMRYRIFRDGICLYEAERGLFEGERDRAFFLHADSEHFRRQQREALYGAP